MSEVYKTKILVEVEVSHFGTTSPLHALEMLKQSLSYKAVTELKVLEIASDYKLHNKPACEKTILEIVEPDKDFQVNGHIYRS
jgi:hypothetical protein